ncbi:MAG TPA: hypothetical protein VNO34_01915 [Actinomycetota bacterium]|nr:hypothetical protein [Actinomycetota bacterium]
MMRCPICDAEIVEFADDGALCLSGHWLERDSSGAWRLMYRDDAEESAAQVATADHQHHESQATRLVRLGREAELWHSQDGDGWATIDANGHREHWPLRSRGFREWLARRFYQRYGSTPNAQALQDALAVLEGDAKYAGPEYPVYVRVAEHDGAIYLDLADPHWRAVEITADGWRVVTNPPVRFKRARGMQCLPMPQRGGSLELLWEYVNVAEPDRPLVAGCLVMALSPRGPYPVLGLGGEQGSGKSTTARVIRRLIDPNEADLRSEPREVRDLAIAAKNGWIVAIDNASKLPQWLSDALCRLSTGAGFATRELYTDTDEVILSAQRPVIITSITDVISAPDLLDRAVLITCPTLEDGEREPEAAFWHRFEADRPLILGALCDLVSRALRELPHVRLERYPRMADFARWTVAALGRDVLERYLDNRAAATSTALEASPVAEAVLTFMVDREYWEGTATELLDELNAAADEETRRRRERLKAWPKTGRGLSGEIRRLAPALRAQGLEVRFQRVGREGRRIVTLERKETQPSVPSAPSAQAQDPHCDADLGTDGWGSSLTVADGRASANRQHDYPHLDAKNSTALTVTDGADGRSPNFSGAEVEQQAEFRCRCGGVLRPSDYPDWLQCERCRQYVRTNDPALRRQREGVHR